MKTSGIYTITNLVNNKVYVGKTEWLETRWNTHISQLRRNVHWNYHLQQAYNKYGEENMKYETLVESEKEFLYSDEHYWVNMLNSLNINYGYNIRPTHPNNKCQPSEEGKKRMGLTKRKAVIVLSTEGKFIARYDSGKIAAKELGIGKQQIYEGASGKYKYYKNYIFLYEKNYDPNKDYYINNTWPGRGVIMKDLNNNIIKEFVSISEASRYMNCSVTTIHRAINKNLKYKEYIWTYVKQ